MAKRPLHERPLVLVVEDEPALLMLSTEMLHEGGFIVLEAQDADEAFEILKARPNTRIVVTDVRMPGSLTGFEFAQLVNRGWPHLGLVVVSGGPGPKPGDLPPNARFLAKPFEPAELLHCVDELAAELLAEED